MRMRTIEEEWLVDILGEWLHSGARFFPEDVALEIISHLVLSPLRREQDGSPRLPTSEDAFSEMGTRHQRDGPAWSCCIPYQSQISGR